MCLIFGLPKVYEILFTLTSLPLPYSSNDNYDSFA